MTDAAPDGATPIFALPPVPLTDEFLLELAVEDDVEQLWVPTGRPAAVTTRAGVHEGDILTFWIERAAVLEGEERQLWRRHERGLRVVQVGEATRSLTSGEYFDYDGCEAVISYLRERYDDDFGTAIPAAAVERELRDIMRRCGTEFPATIHYGEEKSHNDFADEPVGFVNGCIDHSDGTVVVLLAALDCEARPERADEDCAARDGAGCEACVGSGRRREKGRGFEGPDADVAESVLASVRETHIARAAGRYARSPEDSEATATV